jgi:hypothetical protein
VEREEMMLAHAVKIDVLKQNDLVVALGEHPTEVHSGILVESRKHLGIHASDSGRSFQETFSIRVLTYSD